MKSRKKSGRARTRLTHFEVRRGGALLLRLSISDGAKDAACDELGALFRKISPGAVVAPPPPPLVEEAEFVVMPEHDGDDVAYHDALRERLAELVEALCDSALDDAHQIVQQELARRSVGMN